MLQESSLAPAASSLGTKEHTTDSILLIDEQGRITFANSQAQRVFGLSSNELLGKDLQQVIHRRPHQGSSPVTRRRASKTAPQTVVGKEECFLNKDGSVVHGLCSKAPLKLDGRSLGAVLVIRDLNEQTWAEQARQETQLCLAALLDSAMDGIVGLDSEERILMCSPSVENIFGYKAGELVGKKLDCLLPQGLPAARIAAAFAADPLRTPPQQAGSLGVLRGVRCNGEEFPIEASISKVEVRGRQFFCLTLRDITERKRVEQAMAESEERQRQSEKMVTVGQLVGGVAHDFNNLLTVIGGHAELLLANSPPEAPMRESLSQIRNTVQRAASLTRQLLAFSRKEVFEPKIVDLNHLILDMEKMVRRLVGEDVTLQTLLAPGLNMVKVDPSQMDQVILNLAVNARDAMPNGGRLTIKTLNVELSEKNSKALPDARPGNYVALVVNDTGCGMTPEIRAKIFEPFFTTKGAGKGTGLGLAVVHGIVKHCAGHIAVHSEPGAGTTFKIYLPAVRGRSAQDPQSAPETIAGGSETILLVEDEEALRKLGSVVLERYGYTVLTAANGREALRRCERHKGKLDLLLTDVVMPGMNGCELAATLRTRRPDLKVILLSGYAEHAIVHRGFHDCGPAFLNKPFSPDALATKVRQVLDGT